MELGDYPGFQITKAFYPLFYQEYHSRDGKGDVMIGFNMILVAIITLIMVMILVYENIVDISGYHHYFH